MTQNDTIENGLYYRHWPVEEHTKPKAVVLLVHGLGEHCQRYEHLASFFNLSVYALSSMDLPGHGKSDGVRGHIDSFDTYQAAVLKLIEKAIKQYPQTKLILLGHSMGGLIATRLLLNHQDKFDAAILSGPAIESPQEPPAWQVAFIKTIAKFFPKAKMLALDASAVSRDPDVVETYMNDPLVSHEKLSAQFLVAMTASMDECKDHANRIKLPLLVMHGEKDVITSPNGSKLLIESVSSGDKALKIYNGLFHEIFNEPEKEQIFAEMLEWVEPRIN